MRTAWLPLLLLAGCSAPGETTEPSPRTTTVSGRTPEDDQKFKEAAARGEVRYGMVKAEVRTALGPPLRTKRTTYRRKSATCWSYEFRDIYFDDDGFVIGWQSLIG